MKCSLGISNFLEEISSLSHSVVFLYFFALIAEEDFLISPCYSLEFCIQMLISFLFSFAFRFSSFHSYLAWAAATGAFSAAERSYPTSEVGGRSTEDPMPERRWPRGVTPRPRSGAVAENAGLRLHRNGQEELPHVQGQGGGREEIPSIRGQGQWPGGDTPPP